jgi:predicted HicB family RNase H-like nuclease
MASDHYTYRVTWSDEDGEYVAMCTEFPSLSHLAATRTDAFLGIEQLVADVVSDMQARGEKPPVAFAGQSFSGKLLVRVPPDLHRRLAIEAAEAGISVNRYVNFKLSMPPTPAGAADEPTRR